MLPRASQLLTGAVSAAYALLGAVLFVAPSWAARNFPWHVSSFLAVTMGGWYIGTSAYAASAARSWRWTSACGLLLYVWAFGIGQGILLAIHADVIRTSATLTWPYVAVFAFVGVSAIVGIAQVLLARPRIDADADRVTVLPRVLSALFVVVVVVLALPLVDGYQHPGSIWPGPLTLISAQGFSVFFLSLALSAAVLVVVGRREPTRLYGDAGLVLSGAILVATFVFIGRFDFGEHPGGLLYVGLYVAVFVVTAWQLTRSALRPARSTRPAGSRRRRAAGGTRGLLRRRGAL
jgi:hypothetical protein